MSHASIADCAGQVGNAHIIELCFVGECRGDDFLDGGSVDDVDLTCEVGIAGHVGTHVLVGHLTQHVLEGRKLGQ